MHNHVDHRWIKTFLKQLKLASRIYLSIAIVLSPIFFINSANASTLAGGSGWRVASTVANGVGVTVNGVKDIIVNGASKTVTGVANVTPTASQVGKFMRKNAGAAAVVGVVDLLLDGADWVLDPANNRIKYNDTSAPVDPNDPTLQYFYRAWSGGSVSAPILFADGSSPQAACSAWWAYIASKGITQIPGETTQSSCRKKDGGVSATLSSLANPAYDPNAENEKTKIISLVDLASQVLDKSEEELRTGNPAVPIATPVTQAAATAVVGEAATDETQARPITAELDKSAAIPTDQTAVGEIASPTTNPETGEVKPGSISLDFPVFCSWAPSMCVLSDKVQQAITDATVWAKNDENQDTDNEPPEIEEIDIDALDTSTFTGVAGCPAPIVVPISFGDGGETEISYEPICQLAEKWSYVAPLIGFLSGALIIVGVGRKGEDGEI